MCRNRNKKAYEGKEKIAQYDNKGGLYRMAIDEILDEIENLVVEARKVPFTNKCIIDDDDLIRLIDDLRNELPQEIQDANHLIQQRQQIINDAKREANGIVEQAKTYAIKLTAEHEIVRHAQTQANEIMEKTIENANQLKEDSLKYANEVFMHLAHNVSGTLDVVQQAHANLKQNKKGQ